MECKNEIRKENSINPMMMVSGGARSRDPVAASSGKMKSTVSGQFCRTICSINHTDAGKMTIVYRADTLLIHPCMQLPQNVFPDHFDIFVFRAILEDTSQTRIQSSFRIQTITFDQMFCE